MPLHITSAVAAGMSQFDDLVAKYQKKLIGNELARLTGNVEEEQPYMSMVVDTPSSTVLGMSFCGNIYQVQCKLVFRYCKSQYLGQVLEGSVVILSAEKDDQYDIGVVVKIFTEEGFSQKLSTGRPFNDREEAEIRNILRLATVEELRKLPRKYEREEQLLVQCQTYVRDVFHLPISVYGAEMQIDGKMLTFYYTSDVRADYRALVRTLFNVTMVRIKMRKTNQCKKFVPVASAAAVLRSGNL